MSSRRQNFTTQVPGARLFLQQVLGTRLFPKKEYPRRTPFSRRKNILAPTLPRLPFYEDHISRICLCKVFQKKVIESFAHKAPVASNC
jgi:hypothetical protein